MPALPTASPTRILTRRTFLAGSIATSMVIGLYSNEIARHQLQIAERTFFLRNLPPAFDGFRIVQFSDIHLEEYTEDYFLREVIAKVNALEPDLLLVTGDFVSRGPLALAVSLAAAGRCAALLRGLTCPMRYGVLGNHDVAVGARIVRDHMEDNGLPLLVNQFVKIERYGEYLYLGGTDSMSSGLANIATAVPEKPDVPVILMAHEPDFALHIASHRRGQVVDLVLSGHTHGGQIVLPGIRPLALPPFGKLFPEGLFHVGNFQLYVNRGIGTVGVPFRLNCPPEITVATLRPVPALR